MNASDARKAHKILDALFKRKPVLDEEREFLRNALPELPKQKTLEEIHEEVYEKWLGVEGDLWDSDNWGTVEEFLGGLQYQLKDLIDAEPANPAPATVPALPAGMRLADHEEYGRVVVSPKADKDGDYLVFIVDESFTTRGKSVWARSDELTFIDTEPAHPEFLETEADYEEAPAGTIVAKDSRSGWTKLTWGTWDSPVGTYGSHGMYLSGPRRVLRWGWGK